MLRFLAFLFVFVLGALLGAVGGGLLGGVGGAVVGACMVVDKAVEGGALTQDQANSLVQSMAEELQVNKGNKRQIVDPMKAGDQPPRPCVVALESI
jgi:outer membrane lipoprotein SlyB